MPSPAPSTFVWYDLMTPDLPAAAAFYTAVAGWSAADSGLPDRAYTILNAGPNMVAGLMGTPANMKDVPPMWNGHIGVDDVDAMAGRVVDAGGALSRLPEDIPNGIGRFAVVSDPGGAVFILFKPTPTTQVFPPPPPSGTPGTIGWHELLAADTAAAWDFYSALFGWTKDEAHDMGPMGVYQTFSAGGDPIGGMMAKPPELPAPTWLFYINVDSVEAAAARIEAAGGKVIMAPREVPGGGWIAQAIDPQGALFAVSSLTK